MLLLIYKQWVINNSNRKVGNSKMKVAYIRVSTVEQNEQRQLSAMEGKGIERYYIEKVSGKDTNRPKLKEMLDFVREGDTFMILAV